jgi:murein DD-endopeptidase MepM/ murein hydrolase activator NlpD
VGSPSNCGRRPILSGITLLCAAVLLVATPVAGAHDDPFGRQRDDPIAVARRQRQRLHVRIDAEADRLSNLRTQSRQLGRRIDRTVDRLSDVTTSIDQLEEEIAVLRVQLGTSEAHRRQLVIQVRSHDWSLRTLGSQAEELESDLVDRRRALGARLAESYRVGKVSLWEQIVDSRSLMDVIVTREALQATAAHDADMAASIARDQEALDGQRRDLRHLRRETDLLRLEAVARTRGIEADRARLRAAEQELIERRRTIQARRVEQEARFRRLARTSEQVGASIRQQRQRSVTLSKRIGTLLEKERHAGRLPSAFNGTLQWPLIGRISQEFGCTGFYLEPSRGSCAHFHPGIDIVGPHDSKIVSPADGVILFVGWDPDVPRRDAAWQVAIAHSARLVTVYGHLQPQRPPGIYEGARVRKGEPIGWMGNTGNSTGAHLHWGVLYDGEEVNPRFFL